ncbi:hypothetical protein PHLGIDRAFT_73697 [Phlebiopsis gigantea 11061_1 CR5-6]|uniref:Uncharacterized protein n=1 Tax=Phlebiopsis gigantea (strain 11061_1 CR5-6) TaxID=745531 RepID=A0A0C3S5V3_PHLG1|nr:hypothetical protein PHLGIDRAFT_73697 [Phlebiopsis gigantea 11061_1 CR5-6]
MRDIQNIVSPRVTSPAKASSVKRFPQRETTPTRPKTSVQTSSVLPSLHPPRTEDAASPPPSPKPLPTTPAKSPRKRNDVAAPQVSPSRLPRALPSNLYPALNAQKRATLKALHEISVLPQGDSEDDDNTEPSANTAAFNQLRGLLTGTVERGEGNSCMVIGPKGSGKTQLVERAISTLPEAPIVIRLSGFAQTNDRLAIREIAWQLAEQTGQSLLPPEQDETVQDDENPFIEPNAEVAVTLPPPSHLLALISMLPTLPRPTIITLDGFDLFALHARQSLLYCLLDTVQSCRAVSGNRGIAVVGVTTRVETINILEKRVKSRFSGRIIRTAGLPLFDNWIGAARHALCSPIQDESECDWSNMWNASVDSFLHDQQVVRLLKETFTLTKDIRVLGRLLVATVIALKPSSPALSTSELAAAVNKQRYPPRFSFLSSLTYPSICLLIAAAHVRTSGHETFTFEMLHDAFQDQVRTSMSAPVTVDGGGIGMAFEKLVSLQVFVATASAAAGIGKEFMKYRCDADRSEIKDAVDKTGQLSLKKWLTKAQ